MPKKKKIRSLEGFLFNKIEKLRQTLYEVGICPECLQERVYDKEEPFSYCRCGTTEDTSGKVPLIQKLRETIKEQTDYKEFHFTLNSVTNPEKPILVINERKVTGDGYSYLTHDSKKHGMICGPKALCDTLNGATVFTKEERREK